MVDTPDARCLRLARHYLDPDSSTTHLREVLALAAESVGFPHAQVNVLDDAVVHTISDHRAAVTQPASRRDSMCHHVTADDRLIAVDDLRLDARSRHLPGVVAGRAASYLGVPLHSRESIAIGTLCFFDPVPRRITGAEKERTRRFGLIVEGELESMRRCQEQRRTGQAPTPDLAHAISSGRIRPWFQPIVDMRTDRTVSYEALARWERPDGRIVDPGTFIPQAEDSDLILDLDNRIAAVALDHFAFWQRSRPDLRLNLNVSTRHLEVDGVGAIHEAVIAAGVSPARITIELTETHRLTNEFAARRAIAHLRDRGYRVVLDDFGTGWSSLDWMLKLPVNGIKIDRAVTAALGTTSGLAMARAFVSLARDLDLNIVIEAISTGAERQIAQQVGFRYAQGYFWAPALRPPDVLRRLI